MKTTNWQTKALTLFIAAAALWLTAACGNNDTTNFPIHYPEGGIRITSTEPCEMEVPLVPSQEFANLPEHLSQRIENDPDVVYNSMVSIIRTRRVARAARLAPEFKRIGDGIAEYVHKLNGDPYIGSVEQWSLTTSDGVPTDRIIVEVHFYYLQDLSKALLEDRIPSCIAGVPVHIIVGEYYEP